MDQHGHEHRSSGLSEGVLCLALFAKYSGLMVYGVWAAIVEIPTFVIIGSSTFAVLWAALTAAFATLAAVGVARTWATGKYRLEQWTTAAFVLTFTAYSSALIWRAWTTGEWASGALSVIPIVVCIMPTIRFYSFVRPRRAKGLPA